MKIKGAGCILGWLLFALTCRGQENQRFQLVVDDVAEQVTLRNIQSAAVNDAYQLSIHLPDGYHDGTDAYPALLVLDADFNFGVALNAYKQLQRENQLRKGVILVGVGYGTTAVGSGNERERDFLPVPFKPHPQAGGADKFLGFLTGELIPFLRKHYRIGEQLAVHGHSFGGLFAMYVLLNKPEAFQTYLISAPSIPWNKDYIVSPGGRLPESLGRSKARVYWAIGEKDDKNMVRAFEKLSKNMQPAVAAGQAKCEVIAGQGHLSVIPQALRRGMVFAFGNQ